MKDGEESSELHEYKCARCAKVFIAAEATHKAGALKCPVCGNRSISRLASVYLTSDMVIEKTTVKRED